MKTNHHDEKEEIEKMAPRLFSIEKQEVFEVPENYFEQLPHKMQDLVHKKPASSFKHKTVYRLASVAASLLLIAYVGSRFFVDGKSNKMEISNNELVASYTNDYLSSADETELIDQLDDAALASAADQLSDNSDLSNQEIEDYLMNENIDVVTLSNEF